MYFTRIEDRISEESWLSFYLNIGRKFFEENSKENDKVNICISVPFLDYAAVAVGLGICDSLYSSTASKSEDDILKSLEPGTLIFYRAPSSKKEKTFTFEGLTVEGYPTLKSIGENPETLTLTRPQLWGNVRIAPEQVKYKTNRTMKNSHGQTVIYKHYERELINNIMRNPKLNFLLIGNERRIREEMSYEPESGHPLSEWLLPKSMNGLQSSYVSDIVSSGTRINSLLLSPDTILIFNGVSAFTQSWYRKLSNPCIILMERTASTELLMSGLDLLNRAIDSKDVSVAGDFMDIVENFPVIPRNIELTAWRR